MNETKTVLYKVHDVAYAMARTAGVDQATFDALMAMHAAISAQEERIATLEASLAALRAEVERRTGEL